MRFLSPLVLLVLASPCLAQDDLAVLKPDSANRKMLYKYLEGQAKELFDSRRKVVAELKTPDDVRKRQAELKVKFIESLGGFPAKTPLNAKVTGKEQRDGYRIEKVVYESQPNHHVTAILYIPDGQGPFPGVLVPCGHSVNGKAAEAYQRASILLARNGLAVLCYDPIGQGERNQLLNSMGKPAIAGSTSEHTMVGVGALLVGRNTATYRIWDGIRSLDYLASRPEVDAKRLGCTGNSGGGTLTAYLMALDDRILAAAPSCYITTLERLFATIGPQDAEQNITGQVAFGMEHTDYVTMRAPRPTLICVGTRDYFDIQGAWTTYREAKLLYGVLGHGERVDLFEYNDTHGFSQPRRQAAMRWMRRWLLGKDDAPTESEFPIAKDPDIQCTRTGQVLEDYKGRSAFDLNRERLAELTAARGKVQAQLGKDGLLKEVRQLIGLRDGPKPVAKWSPPIRSDGYAISKGTITPEPGITLPALLFEPAKQEKGPWIIYLNGAGKAADLPAIEKLVQSGRQVLAVDLRGLGETAPGAPGKGHFGVDQKEAFLALHLNRPLLGQRVFDIVQAINALPAEAQKEVEVMGVGSAGPTALHAAALDGRIKSLTLEQSVPSWAEVVKASVSRNQLTNVVPGALRVYDLPDLEAAVKASSRSVTIRNPVGP